jgi:hypothetical protein
MKPDAGTIIPEVALALLATGLVGAGLYGLFGKPASHEGKQRKRHVIHGFQLGGGVVLGMILMGALVGCSQIALGIVEPGRISRIVAFFIAFASLRLIFSMIRNWAKHFAGWVGYSVLNGIHMITTGHVVNEHSILVPRWWSISATALMFTSAFVSRRFVKNYTLTAMDKAALMAWLLAFVFAIDVESTNAFYREPLGLGAMFAGTLALLAARLHYRATRHHRISATPERHSI